MSTENIISLQKWAQEGRLKDAQLNSDGSQLTLGDTISLSGTDKVTVTLGDTSFQYTLASIFLYIVNPDQSLVEYRKACRNHKVSDPVKVSDKTTVLGYFLGTGSSVPTTSADITTTASQQPPGDDVTESTPHDSAVAGTAVVDDEAAAHSRRVDGHSGERKSDRTGHTSRSSSDKSHHRDKENRHHRSSSSNRDGRQQQPRPPSSSSDRKRDRSSQDTGGDNKRKDKVRKDIDPEKLFSNLSGVVGKREIKAQRDAEQAKLHKALSTDGFAVSVDVLKDYQRLTASIMAHEIPVGDSSSILKAAAGKDLSRILKLYNETMAASSDKNSSRAGKKGGPTSSSNQPKSVRTYLVGKKPIIVLPKGMTAPVTLVNAYEFFANSRFVPRDKMMQQLRTDRAAPKTDFSRTVNSRLGGGMVEYELMDNPKSKLNTPQDWDRVVAVVALGQTWQFKDWPGPYADPAQLFGRTFGFYVGMEGDVMPPEVMQWSVTRSKLNRDKRGMDSVTYASFWNALDEWMTIHKPEMLPQRNE